MIDTVVGLEVRNGANSVVWSLLSRLVKLEVGNGAGSVI